MFPSQPTSPSCCELQSFAGLMDHHLAIFFQKGQREGGRKALTSFYPYLWPVLAPALLVCRHSPARSAEGRCYRTVKSHCFRKKSRHLGSPRCLSSQTELEILQSPECNHHRKRSGTAHEMIEPGEPPNLGSTVRCGLRNHLHSASVLSESSFTGSLKAHLLQHSMTVTHKTVCQRHGTGEAEKRGQDQAAAACPGPTLAPPLQQTLLLPPLCSAKQHPTNQSWKSSVTLISSICLPKHMCSFQVKGKKSLMI